MPTETATAPVTPLFYCYSTINRPCAIYSRTHTIRPAVRMPPASLALLCCRVMLPLRLGKGVSKRGCSGLARDDLLLYQQMVILEEIWRHVPPSTLNHVQKSLLCCPLSCSLRLCPWEAEGHSERLREAEGHVLPPPSSAVRYPLAML